MGVNQSLFEEAQEAHARRKTDLQKQMVIDNLYFIMQQMILKYAVKNSEEITREQRNRKVIDLAKRTIKAASV